MNKYCYALSFAIVIATNWIFTPISYSDDTDLSDRSHRRMVINRSRLGNLNQGTKCYDYTVIDEYSSELSDEELGNYKIDQSVECRELNIIREVKSNASAERVRIGVVEDPKGRLRKLNTQVTIEGDIEAEDSNEIGVYYGKSNNNTDIDIDVEINDILMK